MLQRLALARKPGRALLPCQRKTCSGQLLVDERGQLGLAHGPDFGGCQLAILEQHQGRNAANAELGRNVAVLVHRSEERRVGKECRL